jgi:2-amino-4-hydroxy-6-hydroxymethyldihydropteridine diphosphokinase
MKNVFLGLGTNLGDREANLKRAIALIDKSIGTVTETSSVYETEPWGFEAEEQFLNMVLKIETDATPSELINKILDTETSLGRKRGEKRYSSRLIDIDILLYDNMIINEGDLKIPHPRMHERRFVMVPLCEIAPSEIHPVSGKSMSELLDLCTDQNKTKKVSAPF